MSTRAFTALLFVIISLGASVSCWAQNNAAYVSQTLPATMVYQKTYAVSVTMQNTGTTTWTAAGAYRLGYWYGNNTWGVQRIELPNSVSPGQQVTFNFNVTATSNAPTSNFRWMMVQDGVQWFGASSPLVAVPVRVNAASFISQSVPGTMVANQANAVSVTMRNNGFHTWNVGAYYLASENPSNNSSFGLNQVALPGPVASGANVTFSFNAVPPSGGTKNFQWRIADAIEGTFGSLSTNVSVAVSGTDSSQYVSQSVPGSMTAGQSYPVSVTLTNNGTTTWSAADGFKLAPHPLPDNATWGVTRVNLPASVPPGQQVTIPFNVTAPTLTGVYSFQWRMLHESVGAFGAASPNVAYPIGQISTEVLFIHVDHLNTPRLVADDQQRSVWRWDQMEPFGVNVPDENPSGLGAFAFHLRFPGQYFDKETGLAYNYFRDYDANIGRYVQSDPIGLDGGLNTFAYVDGSPLSQTDPRGLFFVTSVDAFCRHNLQFCLSEVVGQIVENTSMITQGCVPDNIAKVTDALQDIGRTATIFSIAAGVAGGIKVVSSVVPRLAKSGNTAAGWGNVAGGATSASNALKQALIWLGPGYKQIAPGVFRSANNKRQFRMTDSDLLDKKLGPHVHFEAIGSNGRTIIESSHLKILDP